MGQKLKPNILVFDDVSETPDALRELVLKLPFENVTSPVDHVTYPFIAKACGRVRMTVGSLLTRALHGRIHINYCFARAMPGGVKAPHQIHHDESMGELSAHIYLNPETWPGTGTQFWKHGLFGTRINPLATEYLPYLYDQSYGTWKKQAFVLGRYNRMLIHDSGLWHSAEPEQGWGKDQHDGRLVLTTFFDRE